MLFTTTLGIIDFFPIATRLRLLRVRCSRWEAVSVCCFAGDPVVISMPSDPCRRRYWISVEQGWMFLMILSQEREKNHHCWQTLGIWSFKIISVPGALNFGDAVRCQTGYMQVAKAGHYRVQTWKEIVKHIISHKNWWFVDVWWCLQMTKAHRSWTFCRSWFNDLFCCASFQGDGLFRQFFLQVEATAAWHDRVIECP